MKRQLSYRVGGLITMLICLVGSLLTRFHNLLLDVFSVCVAIACLAIFMKFGRHNSGFKGPSM